MKYTRYDLKRKNDNKAFILMILLVFILAFILGTAIFRLLTGNALGFNSGGSNTNNGGSVNNSSKAVDSSSKNTDTSDKIVKYIAVQGGIYQNKENVDSEKNLLIQYGTPFTVVENDKTRVFLGVYTESHGEEIIKSLSEQKVDNSKMLFTISKKDLCDSEITEIINANLQILNKLSEKDVKAIQTEELKKWCSSLKKVDKDSKNINLLNDIKNHVNNMPKELPKDKAAENYAYIYSILKKMSQK
ncbi:hypothetical protein N4T77_16740 [Clostridium sp. CX1]|uniref:hypothetical protein n=1 Tax=Clostridium sp. CX1 TaxID=2978346 RepID=UPI0021BFB293|nr:hypothetical protein [Clostridium sp. CX1]MCT8978237.1 hypothetical protein [Clostridium sp. CX1]